MEYDRIYCMDCIKGMSGLGDDVIDLIVTSPPYNVDLGNNRYNSRSYDVYRDNLEHREYIQWLQEVFSVAWRKLRDGGRVCINIGDGKNGAIPTHSDITQMMVKELEYLPLTTIIWNKYQTSNRTAWGSWLSPSCPSFPRGFEYILVFAKNTRKLTHKGESDLTRDEFISWTNGLWAFAPENQQRRYGHPAMFPEELPKRCIKLFSYKGDLVIDPFMGAGTTLKVARELGRSCIGFDISSDYCAIASERTGLDVVEQGIHL